MNRGFTLLALVCAGVLYFWISASSSQAQSGSPGAALTGAVLDRQGQPVQGAMVSIQAPGGSGGNSAQREGSGTLQAYTQADGHYLLPVPDKLPHEDVLVVERAHFQTAEVPLPPSLVEKLNADEAVFLEDVVLLRQINPAFWVATCIFVLIRGNKNKR